MAGQAGITDSREQLWGLLFEAAEIEHNLMCCYLYACFSLKQGLEEDLTQDELDAVRRWRGEMLGVAIEEMAHLAIVCNILSSLGAPAHLGRPNFPIAPGYHPAGVVVKLAPFNVDTLDHFIFLERPDSIDAQDGQGFEPAGRYQRTTHVRLMTSATDYDTVGQLYESIKQGLVTLAAKLGEHALFVGAVDHQVSPALMPLSNLKVVRCLKTALQAIDAIITQGEGSSETEVGSHYHRFLAIRDEYRKLLAARPGFHPGRHVAHNPVMRRPPVPEGKVWVNVEPAVSLMDLGNALYGHSLRCLALAYAGVDAESQRVLIGTSVELMRFMTPVAERLTTLPANPDYENCTAGLSFAMLRSAAPLPAEPGGLKVLAERLEDIAQVAKTMAHEHPALADLVSGVAEGVSRSAQRMRRVDAATATAPALERLAPAASSPAPPAPTPKTEEDGTEVIAGARLDLVYKGKLCIHSRHCVLGQPKVFKANVQGPWIDPDACSVESLVTVAHQCPSGAIGYRRKDGGDEEAAPPINLLQLRENGPLGLRAEMRLDGVAIGMRATLCRCGASKNKPYCDGSHNEVHFRASGEPETRPSEPLARRGGMLDIEPETNGPLVVSGNLELCCGTGRTFDRVETVRLCRCGGSANKPYCDGSHRRVGFRSD